MAKYKKTIWVALAVVFIVVLFLAKTTSIFKNKVTYKNVNTESGLSYGNLELEELVNKDTDEDGVLDWEEGLWGTDPTKAETIPGTKDSEAVANLKAKQVASTEGTATNSSGSEKLTQTDQFSRDLFATIASLSQSGEIDEATIEKLSDSLAEKIKNPDFKKVFVSSDLKVVNDNSLQAVENYLTSIDAIYKKYPQSKSVTDIFKEFINDGENVKINALVKLDPAIKNLSGIIDGLVKISVPQGLAPHHLNLVNTLENLKADLVNIKLFDTDPIIAMGAIVQYEKNTETLESITAQLNAKIITMGS